MAPYRALFIATTAAALTFTASPAIADGHSLYGDPRDDLYTDAGPVGHTSDYANADLAVTDVLHRPHRVVVKATYYDLVQPRAEFDFGMALNVEQRGGDTDYSVAVEVTPGNSAGELIIKNAKGETVDCGGKSHSIDYNDNTIIMIIPRSCIGGPDWLRFQAWSMKVVSGGRSHWLFDDARGWGDPADDDSYSETISWH